MPVVSGCSWFLKKEPLTVDNYCDKTPEFPDDEESKNYLINSPVKFFEWGKVNITTRTCDCKKTTDEKQKCYQKFLDLENAH